MNSLKTLKDKTTSEWQNWLSHDAVTFAKEGRDVRVTTRAGSVYVGSVATTSPAFCALTVLTYDNPASVVVVDAKDIASVEIFNSRRLRPDDAYRQMREIERILKPTYPVNIDDTCP